MRIYFQRNSSDSNFTIKLSTIFKDRRWVKDVTIHCENKEDHDFILQCQKEFLDAGAEGQDLKMDTRFKISRGF